MLYQLFNLAFFRKHLWSIPGINLSIFAFYDKLLDSDIHTSVDDGGGKDCNYLS